MSRRVGAGRGARARRAPGRRSAEGPVRGVRTGALGALAVAALALVAAPPSASAQTILGRVLDETTEQPILGAVVSLLTFTGAVEAQTLTEGDGTFRISPTREGEYYLEASRLGYETGRTPLLMLQTEGTAPLDLLLRPAPVGLRGLEVTVDRLQRIRDELRFAGLTPERLGQRFLSRADFEDLLPRADVGNVLEWSNIPGIGFLRTEDLAFMSDDIGLCVHLERAASTAGGWRPCAIGVLDGVPVPGTLLQAVNPWDLEAIAVLLPQEASMLYGRLGRGGAVMLWRAPER